MTSYFLENPPANHSDCVEGLSVYPVIEGEHCKRPGTGKPDKPRAPSAWGGHLTSMGNIVRTTINYGGGSTVKFWGRVWK